MWRTTVVLLACALLLGNAPRRFGQVGVRATIDVTRNGRVLPASYVPFLQRGDIVDIAFPKGIQFSRNPRWHLVVADLYKEYLQRPPTFVIRDATLGKHKPGYIWRVPYDGHGYLIAFLVPESGNRYGHGVPEARHAIADMANRELLLKTATISANAQAKSTLLASFLSSMTELQGGDVADGRERVVSGARALFGTDLGSAPCFATDASQGTQYACAAGAITTDYESAPRVDIAAVIGSQLSVSAATYGVLVGALYQLLARRRVYAHYTFVPGAIRAGSPTTNVYVSQQLDYDASAVRASTIVYFRIAGKKKANASYETADPTTCLQGDTVDEVAPFSGSPLYFRSHAMVVAAGGKTFDVPATYDPIAGYQATLSTAQIASLASGGSASIESRWGFARFDSPQFRIVVPHHVTWTLKRRQTPSVVTGSSNATLTFTDGKARMGSCVDSVSVTDGLGRNIPVTGTTEEDDSVTLTLDASAAIGPRGTAAIASADGTESVVRFPIAPALPEVTSAIAYLPRGVLVLRGSNLKYIDTVALENTGIVFGSGVPNADGSWTFTLLEGAPYEPAWEHETTLVSFTLQPPDTRTSAAQVDVEYASAKPAGKASRGSPPK
ncbi:MAG: hypothetical protein ACREMP_09325 [Candidatus Tyrphobacter sp.]